MINSEKVRSEIEEIIKEEGFESIELKIFFNQGNHIVRCVVDSPEGGITMDRCAGINKKIVYYLECSKALGENFAVEVNSPGLDRPLKSKKDFLRVKGRVVSLWFREPVLDKPSLEAEVLNIKRDVLLIKYQEKVLEVNFDNIKVGKEKITVG